MTPRVSYPATETGFENSSLACSTTVDLVFGYVPVTAVEVRVIIAAI